MSYTSDVRDNVGLPEYGKFVRIDNDTRYPAISVVRTDYTIVPNVTSLETYPKYAVLTYNVEAGLSQGATLVQGSAPPSIVSQSVVVFNSGGSIAQPVVVLASGNSVTLFVGPSGIQTFSIAISGVTTYAGCTFTILA